MGREKDVSYTVFEEKFLKSGGEGEAEVAARHWVVEDHGVVLTQQVINFQQYLKVNLP